MLCYPVARKPRGGICFVHCANTQWNPHVAGASDVASPLEELDLDNLPGGTLFLDVACGAAYPTRFVLTVRRWSVRRQDSNGPGANEDALKVGADCSLTLDVDMQGYFR